MRIKELHFNKNNKVYKQTFKSNLYITIFFLSFKNLNNVIYAK